MPGLPQIGAAELVIVLAVILLSFGARRVPELARSLGTGVRELREGIAEGDGEDAGDRKHPGAGRSPDANA